VTGRACSAEAATGAMTGKTTAATSAMTGKTTAATSAMTGKTVVAVGPGCSGNRELDDQAGHAAVWASGASCGAAATLILAAFWHPKPTPAY
jgi:hypothetical protein